MEWSEISAGNGNDAAAYRLGKEYLSGRNVPKDAAKATDYLTQAAEAGNPYAQYVLGKLSLQQQGKPNTEYWFAQSAAQDNTCAQFSLDRMESLRPPSVMLAVTRLLPHMSRIFQDNSLPKSNPVGMQIDRKRLQKLREKKIAMGRKPDGHEEYAGPTMSMW